MNNWINQNYEYIIEKNFKYVYYIVERLRSDNIDNRELIKAGIRGIIDASNQYQFTSCDFTNNCICYIIKYVYERKNDLINIQNKK